MQTVTNTRFIGTKKQENKTHKGAKHRWDKESKLEKTKLWLRRKQTVLLINAHNDNAFHKVLPGIISTECDTQWTNKG